MEQKGHYDYTRMKKIAVVISSHEWSGKLEMLGHLDINWVFRLLLEDWKKEGLDSDLRLKNMNLLLYGKWIARCKVRSKENSWKAIDNNPD